MPQCRVDVWMGYHFSAVLQQLWCCLVCDVWRCVQGGYVANTTSDVRYSADLALVPVRSSLSDWFGDYTAVSKAVQAMGTPLTRPLASRREAAVFAASAAYAGRIRNVSPHCSRHGVVCNSMGRVVHFDAAVATAQQPPGTTASASAVPAGNATEALRGIISMPWLVSVNFEDAGVSGRIPSAAELEWQPSMVRRCVGIVCSWRRIQQPKCPSRGTKTAEGASHMFLLISQTSTDACDNVCA